MILVKFNCSECGYGPLAVEDHREAPIPPISPSICDLVNGEGEWISSCPKCRVELPEFQRPDIDPLRGKPPREHPADLLARGEATDQQISTAHKHYASELHHLDGDPHNNDPENLQPRLITGTRVRSVRHPVRHEDTRRDYDDVYGQCVGFDGDLRLPLIRWEGQWVGVGIEACEPHEYVVVRTRIESRREDESRRA